MNSCNQRFHAFWVWLLHWLSLDWRTDSYFFSFSNHILRCDWWLTSYEWNANNSVRAHLNTTHWQAHRTLLLLRSFCCLRKLRSEHNSFYELEKKRKIVRVRKDLFFAVIQLLLSAFFFLLPFAVFLACIKHSCVYSSKNKFSLFLFCTTFHNIFYKSRLFSFIWCWFLYLSFLFLYLFQFRYFTCFQKYLWHSETAHYIVLSNFCPFQKSDTILSKLFPEWEFYFKHWNLFPTVPFERIW